MTSVKDLTISTIEIALELGLSSEEYAHICTKLERKPNYAELGIFSAMFSEHCSYKSSRRFFARFPTTGKRVLQGPGENAGILDLGSGWAVAFKMESHNHPSFIEPFQGAATGVGGILRDIFTMGARPIGSMNSLCFGSYDNDKTSGIVRGVVKGIGDYGNCVGVPTVAGQTFFHHCYNQNPLVNAFSLGIVKTDQILRGVARGIGNLVVYVGSKTGRDGVHGATMSSKEFSAGEEPDRPTVQVGDPFTEKLLLEATLEAMNQKLIVGIQDMGAAGLTSSSFEMAHRGKSGLEIDLGKVPVRELGMSAYELLLSESQERMLLVCDPKNWPSLSHVFDKWDLHAEAIGKVVEGQRVKMLYQGHCVVDLPVDLVANPPMLDRQSIMPQDLKQRWFIDRNRMLSAPLEQKLEAVLSDFNFADPTPLVEQYDSTVGNRTESDRFNDSAVLRLRECQDRHIKIALTVDCNPRVAWLHPREGGRRAVAEAATNIAVKGAMPIGITDCLNFASPENPEVMWQFKECIEGISEACEALNVPVISGNVSFYNETDGQPIYPTPMIGMVGLMEGSDKILEPFFPSTQMEFAVVGLLEGGLGGSSLAYHWFKRDCGKPEETDLKQLVRAVKFFSSLRKQKITVAIHDISDGGLVVSALEMAFHSPHRETLGLEIMIPAGTDPDRFLFGEAVPRAIIAYDSVDRTWLESESSRAGMTFTPVGQVADHGEFKILQGGSVVIKQNMAGIRQKWSNKWQSIFNLST